MISDADKDFIYLADTLPLKFKTFYENFTKAIKSSGLQYELLKGTADIWAVDYMPVQLSEKTFVKYDFNPVYLRNKRDNHLLTDIDTVWHNLELDAETINCELYLEGGNLVYEKDKMIVTEKVFSENPDKIKKQIIQTLENLFKAQIIIIPVYPGDWTGHADGVVRFVNSDTVLINEPYENDECYKELTTVFQQNKLDFINIPCCIDPFKKGVVGLYLNYLHVGKNIFAPIFDISEDEKAILFFEDTFKKCKIIPVQSKQIARKGGVLRCVSWEVKI